MVALLVVLTVIALVAVDYFVVRKRLVVRRHRVARSGIPALARTTGDVPGGVFLQPSFTWSRIQADGDLQIGVHPLLLGLIGTPYHIDFLNAGARIERGAPLVRIGRGGRQLTVRSPVGGRVTAVNDGLAGEAAWASPDHADGTWFYRIRPEAIADEIPHWMFAERAVEWTRQQYDRARAFLANVGRTEPVGVTMADGGEIPVGILASLDEDAWGTFQHAFLDQGE